MKTLIALVGGALAALLAVVLWQQRTHKSMLRHLQLCIAWNDRQYLQYPTERAKRTALRHEEAA